IMNNREYRTLQVGLQQVISAYSWQPQTNDPAYLRIQGPEVDFVSLAKAFGVTAGRRVSEPLEVERAIQEAVSHVLEKKEPYVLELWTDQAPQQPPAVLSLARMAAPAGQPRRQPLLDVVREPSDDGLLTSAAVIP
ncbi:MAG TPA: thiamine pyrophosphate-dependent enzyme, partial [Archangium sp.]|nr:thiamine pyrophosphate-dependent enzyme [Archangium sp.]